VLDVNRVVELIAELSIGYRAERLDEAIGERGFAVVDVSDDAEISNPLHV